MNGRIEPLCSKSHYLVTKQFQKTSLCVV
uniref:Uncharacterized protein n=1 Tax=Arundo donax TaxID=35708 RepID=A0A0A8ZGT4_ARUDO